jgi:hypothetical protein
MTQTNTATFLQRLFSIGRHARFHLATRQENGNNIPEKKETKAPITNTKKDINTHTHLHFRADLADLKKKAEVRSIFSRKLHVIALGYILACHALHRENRQVHARYTNLRIRR